MARIVKYTYAIIGWGLAFFAGNILCHNPNYVEEIAAVVLASAVFIGTAVSSGEN